MSSAKVIDARFQKAVELIGKLPKDGEVKPTQDDQLTFYGLFKQANDGDNTKPKPGMMDFSGKYKWQAYEANKGMSKDDAKAKYVDYFIELLKKNPGSESDELIKQIDEAGAAAESA